MSAQTVTVSTISGGTQITAKCWLKNTDRGRERYPGKVSGKRGCGLGTLCLLKSSDRKCLGVDYSAMSTNY